MPLSSAQCHTCLAIRSVAADGETPSPIPTYIIIDSKDQSVDGNYEEQEEINPSLDEINKMST